MKIKKLWKTETDKFLAGEKKTLERIEALDATMKGLTDEALANKTNEFKKRLQAGETEEDLLVEAFAVVREASFRILGMKPFPVQLLGGIALHQGKVAEMKTGEGKTLVATLPSYLNALSGKGVHVVTVNDYLTERDHNLNQPLFEFLGLSTGFVIHKMSASEKRDAYQKDITYVVNSQVGFDYLHDNRAFRPEDCIQRELHFAIIDEVDSILLDEARTPLIISREDGGSSHWIPIVDVLVKHLSPDEYEVEAKDESVSLTEKGIDKMERILNKGNLMDTENAELNYSIRQALIANYHFKKDKHYLVNNGQVELIDENTGRVTKGRRYTGGLHQAIEAKENVKIQDETTTLASITYQYFFSYYEKISGMTGTAITEEEEFYEVYGLEVVVVPTNKPIRRKDSPDLVYVTHKQKMDGILKDIKKSQDINQPVLVGVSTIEQSEEMQQMLTNAGLLHDVLNAKNHAREADIVSKAGELGAITIATNMAGRGTDIKISDEVKKIGGLKVIGTERNMNRRVDNQLRGRSGRQGDVGESKFHVSLEDELMQVFATDSMKNIIEILGTTTGEDSGVVQNKMVSSFIERTQVMLEGQHFDARKQTIEFDGILSAQRELIYTQRNQLLHDEICLETFLLALPGNIVEKSLHSVFEKKALISKQTFRDIASDIHRRITEGVCEESEYITHLPRKNKLDYKQVKEALARPSRNLVHARLCNYKNTTDYGRQQLKTQMLTIVDNHWRNYLIEVEEIQKGIHLVSYAGDDPMDAFLRQTTDEFNRMITSIQVNFLRIFIHAKQEKVDTLSKKHI